MEAFLSISIYVIIGFFLGISIYAYEHYYNKVTGSPTKGLLGILFKDGNLILLMILFWPLVFMGYVLYYLFLPVKFLLDRVIPKLIWKCLSKEKRTRIALGIDNEQKGT